MTCSDVYTLAAPPACGDIWAFGSQVHPVITGGGFKGGRPYRPEYQPTQLVADRKPRLHNDDEDVALLIGLGII